MAVDLVAGAAAMTAFRDTCAAAVRAYFVAMAAAVGRDPFTEKELDALAEGFKDAAEELADAYVDHLLTAAERSAQARKRYAGFALPNEAGEADGSADYAPA